MLRVIEQNIREDEKVEPGGRRRQERCQFLRRSAPQVALVSLSDRVQKCCYRRTSACMLLSAGNWPQFEMFKRRFAIRGASG